MKTYKLLLFLLALVAGIGKSYAQIPKNQAEADALARRIRTMTPSQMLKFRDSMINAVKKQQAAIIPNGKQLLLENHYDTSYTTVRFYYTKQESQYTTKAGGQTNILINGKSAKAIMIREANGHTVISCSLNPPGANTAQMDKGVKALNKSLKYMTHAQQLAATNLGRQTAFSTAAVNNNSISGTASENGHYSGGGGNTAITTKPPVIKMAFSFIYDPVEGFSTISVGGTYHRHTESSGIDEFKHMEHGHTDDTVSAGMGGTTDPHESHLTGGATPKQSNADESYIRVVKTARGFHIGWTKLTKYPEANGKALETLSADIGEPDIQYEALIQPIAKFKYETWLPKGPKVDGSDDTKGNDSAQFYVLVRDKNDPTKIYPGNYTVKWALHERTRYKGFNSNYPLVGNNPNSDPDLKFSDSLKMQTEIFDMASMNDSVAMTQDGKGDIGIARIMCMDYGAWGKLAAAVHLDDGTELLATPYYDRSKTYITIPFDKDENKIADEWEKAVGIFGKGYGMDWDEDVKPDNHNNGDNIPLIDEYRGYMVEDEDFKPIYARLSPAVKELFTIGLTDKSANGNTFKVAVRKGALGYSKMTTVKVYHFDESKYGRFEAGENYMFGRWVNCNTPTRIHTHGVVIYTYDIANATGDPNSLGSTKAVFPDPPNYSGAQTPDETEVCKIWGYNLMNVNEEIAKAKEWYLPANTDGFHAQVDPHISHINSTYHLNFDINKFSDVVKANSANMLQQIISFTVAHEICHATNVGHHHLAQGTPGGYRGVNNCPARYWLDWTQEDDHADWMTLFFAGKWDPSTWRTPDGADMSLCTSDDNCFNKLKLKKK